MSAQTTKTHIAEAIRGRVLRPSTGARAFDLLPDALIALDSGGRISAIGPAPADCQVAETQPGAVWLPGFVDTHVHFPQLRVMGRSSGALLDWLDKTVFPEEARFAEKAYASAVAAEFCRGLAAAGTTTASIYGSSHPAATAELFAALDRAGLRARLGLTLMDRNAPPAVCLDATAAIVACEALVARWHGHDGGRLEFAVTPRFALSCSPELLDLAGELADGHGLPIQTHLSENRAEIAAVGAAFPDARNYLDVYARFGLCNDRTIFGHCIHLADEEWAGLSEHGAAVAHCPDSNFFLGSGLMPLRRALAEPVRVGLGTDVGAGRSLSVRATAAAGYDAALLRGERVEPETLLWLATVGGAAALGLGARVGPLEPGFEADLVAVGLPPTVPADDRSAVIDALLFARDQTPIKATLVRGRRVV